jgi:tetratricopeptide (TPR) repeat protein
MTDHKMFLVTALAVLSLAISMPGCASKPKPKVREPLPLPLSAVSNAQQATLQGSQAYRTGDYDGARTFFLQAVSAAPNLGETHYNLGLALFKLGDTDAARDHFMQAGVLAPGNKVIWDSPAHSPYGTPDPNIPKKEKEHPYANSRPGFGGGPR